MPPTKGDPNGFQAILDAVASGYIAIPSVQALGQTLVLSPYGHFTTQGPSAVHFFDVNGSYIGLGFVSISANDNVAIQSLYGTPYGSFSPFGSYNPDGVHGLPPEEENSHIDSPSVAPMSLEESSEVDPTLFTFFSLGFAFNLTVDEDQMALGTPGIGPAGQGFAFSQQESGKITNVFGETVGNSLYGGKMNQTINDGGKQSEGFEVETDG